MASVLELEFLMIRFDKTERGDQRLICRSRELGIKGNESRYIERHKLSVRARITKTIDISTYLHSMVADGGCKGIVAVCG